MTSLGSLLNNRLPSFPRSDKAFDAANVRRLRGRSGRSIYANRLGQEMKEPILNFDRLDGVPPAKDTGELCIKCHLERGYNF